MKIKLSKNKLCWGLVAAMVAVCAKADDAAPGLFKTQYSGTISGAVTSAQIDAVDSGDGVKSNLVSLSITSKRFGQILGHALIEDRLASTPSRLCPDGTDVEFTLGAINAVQRFPNGDLLYLNAHERVGCLDFDLLTVQSFEEGEIGGGTGQFAQAVGDWKITSIAQIQTIDPNFQLFGPFSGEFSGTIYTPEPLNMDH